MSNTAHVDFYFVGESSLASTNQESEFLNRLGTQDRAILIGDTRQHQGVEAGRPFEQLQQAGKLACWPCVSLMHTMRIRGIE